jgi:hypothetical protein
MDELVIKAAQNNAEWCDIVCRTHEIPGEFLENIWINQSEVPTFYPNAVTTKPLSHENFSDISEALKKIPLKSYAIKDSFKELPADNMDYKVLFEADWITYSPNELINLYSIEDWTIIKNDQELKDWEFAWNNNQPIDNRIFLSSILSVKGVSFLAKSKKNQIIAGGITNIAQDVIGLSNVFNNDSQNNNVWNEISSFIKEKTSNLPIVGYERDNALLLAHKAGYKTIGTLKVLLKN